MEILNKKLFTEQKKYQKIYVIGGEEAVSKDVEEDLKTYTREIVRLSGPTRYETSIEIAKEVIALGGNRLPIVTSGKDPVLYAATLANKYRIPIIYLDTPPVRETTFKHHGTVEGSLAVEGFNTFQAIGDKSTTYLMKLDIKTKGIKDAWMYLHVIGFDSIAEKWTLKLNDYPLSYRVHSEPVAIHERTQLVRFDVGGYLKEGENTLYIEGTDFNIDDQYYITGATFVILHESNEKTEYWINEDGDPYFEKGTFNTPKNARLYTIHLGGTMEGQVELNGKPVVTREIETIILRDTPAPATLKEAEVKGLIGKENYLSGNVPDVAILAVTSNDIAVSSKKAGKEIDPHQDFVKRYLDQEKFDSVSMVYHKDSIPGL